MDMKKNKPRQWASAEWDVALTEDEIELLAAGVSPNLIQPEHLVKFTWDGRRVMYNESGV